MTFLRRYIFYLIAVAATLLLASCTLSHAENGDKLRAEELSSTLEGWRYRSSDSLYRLASAVDTMRGVGHECRAVARNGAAYSLFMQMDYRRAAELYSAVIKEADCEIEALVADVGMMLICYRTSANREFFDYRSSALQRVSRINEEEALLPEGERERFYAARVELAAVSLCYFANLGMTTEAEAAAEYLKRNIELVDSLSRRIYGRVLMNYRPEVPPLERVEALSQLLVRAEAERQLWLAANSRLMLAVLLRGDEVREKAAEALTQQMKLINTEGLKDDELAQQLALRAAEEFSRYGDSYMVIEALSVAASCCTQNGRFDEALSLLDDAMGLVNDYYATRYPEAADTLTLDFTDPDAEWRLLSRDSLANIYECLLSVRREASCAFAGVGDKYLSDVNRNSYLDLLRTTRLNKQIESRIKSTEASASRLYVWALLLAVVLVAVSVAVYMLGRRWRRRSREYVDDLSALQRLCRRLIYSLPKEIDSAGEVIGAVADILNSELAEEADGCRFSIVAADEPSADDAVARLPLLTLDEPSLVLVVQAGEPLSRQRMLFLRVALPYIAAAIDEGRRVADIGGERLRLSEQRLSYALYLDEHKREYVDKRVALSLVGGMRPYIDRMLNELRRLSTIDAGGDEAQRRLQYLVELTGVLDDYNELLARWIKMRRGELSLQIENFPLSAPFGIIAKSAAALSMRGISLRVFESNLVVKADRALTLFMINTLVENAAKFTPRGGTVALEAIEGNDFVEIAVADTGVGMSAADVDKILNSKVYDASSIGASGAMAANKGSGFGLMNCKGIIEKYRKTDAAFAVCRMDIKSEPGKGSRFSFRLPKGVMRTLLVLFFAAFPFAASAQDDDINALADSVYSCNVRGEYAAALDYAREVVDAMNSFYKERVGGADTLSLDAGAVSEIKWWRDALFADTLMEYVYYNLLDMRNEAAVAALALGDWQTYRYNNAVYTQLYRLVHEDGDLVHYYQKMQSVANYRRAAIVLCITLLLVLAVVAVVMYMRRIVAERMNSDILLRVNARLLQRARDDRGSPEGLAQSMSHDIFVVLHDYMKIKGVSVLLGSGAEVQTAAYPSEALSPLLPTLYAAARPYVSGDSLTRAVPLLTPSSDSGECLGMLCIECERRLSVAECTLVELIADYAASAAYHAVVRLAQEYRNLDEVREETARTMYEENNMHVRNMVIDNCLSIIKHETVYYPGRIRELVQRLGHEDKGADAWRRRVDAMCELMDYYSSIFGVLASCAARQMHDAHFKVSRVPLSEIFKNAASFAARKGAKRGSPIKLDYEPTDAVALGDYVLIEYLVETLIEAVAALGACRLHLSAEDKDGSLLVAVECKGPRLGEQRAASFFVPRREGAEAMEPLIAREIVRMHEDYMDRRAARLVAFDTDDGCAIHFTLPKLNNE
ncbi:MAG: DUF5113 domain-containing protein [Bacteroidaceae bacterium]|nr:DUF5113 domain-containing protein [Bacteroidaceae bacterium]